MINVKSVSNNVVENLVTVFAQLLQELPNNLLTIAGQPQRLKLRPCAPDLKCRVADTEQGYRE